MAHQEVEVWMLALHADAIDASFKDVRAECDPKERFADPVLDRLELAALRDDLAAWWKARA